MKILITAGLIFTFSFFSITRSVAQDLVNTSEVIIKIPSLNSKNYNEIQQMLVSMQGISSLSFCESIKSFLIYYDPKMIESGEAIAKKLESSNPHCKTEIKTGTSIAQLIDSCSKVTTTSK